MKKRSKGFTLVETITVLVIIAILSTMLIVGIRGHRRAIKIAQTRLQFLQYESAINRYFRYHGDLPTFFAEEELVSLADRRNSELFIKILSGAGPSGERLSNEEAAALNPKRRSFHQFTRDEFYRRKDGTVDNHVLADAFNNKNIFLIIENPFDDDVIVPKEKFPESVRSHIKNEGITNPVVIFSVSEDGRTVLSNCFD